MKLVLASGNRGKLAELQAAFSSLDIDMALLPAEGAAKDALARVQETGATYEQNARLKASAVALASGLPALADDSGIEVSALDGAPGVRSARACEGSDADRVEWLLRAIDGRADRRAAFAACIVIALPIAGECRYFSCEGRCEGSIANSARGERGFGYDPVFIPDGYDRTFGELGADVKREISHRAAALRGIALIAKDVVKYWSRFEKDIGGAV